MNKTIGIVGGGQLGRMLTEAAPPLGFSVIVLNPSANSPAAQVGAQEIVGDLYDEKSLNELASRSDFITVEIEHLDAGLLQKIAATGKPVNPAPATISMIQDKFKQKEFLREAGVPVADFVEITDRESAEQALQAFDGKMLLKTRLGAYDGRGNTVVSSLEELDKALTAFGDQPLYAERFIPFQKELAVMVARDMESNIATYPVVETIQERSICTEVLAPAPIELPAAGQARDIALQVANHLEGAGVFGIEMFLTVEGNVILNEIAPRVHNSGHYTIEACQTSQFENHIRAITGMPLGSTEMKVPAAVMVNILGERDGPVELKGLEEAEADPLVKVHLYGKSPTKIDRKMGHLTATGDTVEEARQRAEAARNAISI